MTNYNKSRLIALAMLFFMTGIVGSRPLIPLLSNDLGATTFQIGIIIALFAFLPLFFSVKLGYLIDRFGSLKPLALSAVLASLSLIIPLLLGNLTGVYLSQVIGGIAQTSFALAAQSFVSVNSSGSSRERNISILSMGVAGGGLVGPLIGGSLSDLIGYTLAIAFLGATMFIPFVIIYLIYIVENKDEKASINKHRVSNKRAFKSSVLPLLINIDLRKAIIVSMLVLLARDFYIYYFPLLANEYGYSATIIGLIIGLHNGAGVLIRWFLIQVIEKWGKSEVVLTSILLSGALLALLPLTDILIFSMIISMLLGAFLGVGQPLSITSTISFSPKNRTAEVLGLRLTFNRLTQFVSPLLFGAIATFFSISAIFYFVAIILGIGSTKSFIKKESKNYESRKETRQKSRSDEG
ncbi:MFS transporter [Alkalihalophilus marmarensis]|jgi:predicted MFS family arabinose efflux permease|uniref:Major facilitator superfamily (MFS) profile domain-containing protein n=1 Tax=Alkalihalophilus marmarensis DSM 21297 TaxID=1188261 RepID=U6SHT2_9BACI|nr:MFS transporter [Alkalihalophilus marmarensis]ERN51289.1 hypothetical protein A33I_20635 [Alkalihalophilus marmarensis DSM 21297]MCM3491583.1 MFS transporter [Alkalihalophilus marmarensis]